MDQLEWARGILMVTSKSSPEQIRKAYRDLVQVWHPDRFTGNPPLQHKASENLKRINSAMRILEGHEDQTYFKEWNSRVEFKDTPPQPDLEPETEPSTVKDEDFEGWMKYDHSSPRMRRSVREWLGDSFEFVSEWIGVIALGGFAIWGVYAFLIAPKPAPEPAVRVNPNPEVAVRNPLEGSVTSPATTPNLETITPQGDPLTQGQMANLEAERDFQEPDQEKLQATVPKPNPPSKTWSLGSSEEDVLRLEGTPTDVYGDTWFYDSDRVEFKNGLVSGFSNNSKTLKVKLQ